MQACGGWALDGGAGQQVSIPYARGVAVQVMQHGVDAAVAEAMFQSPMSGE